MNSVSDYPKSLKEPQARQQKLAKLNAVNTKPLTHFVEEIRKETGMGKNIPYFDPDDGGVDARCLFLLEAPGPKAVESGFISRNNPDETARNFFDLNQQAGIPREVTVTWNIVPWYIGTGKKIRAANNHDILEGIEYLTQLLFLLPKLELVVLIGKKAQKAEVVIKEQIPEMELMSMYHPSPMFINRAPGHRDQVLVSLQKVARFLAQGNNKAP